MWLTHLRCSLLAAFLIPWDARGASPPQIIEASYSAPAGCGDARRLATRFQERVPELKMEFDRDAPVRFTLRRGSGGASAELVILLEDGGRLSRIIEADNCTAAIDVIAFVAAVALDPGAEEPLQIRKQEPQDKEPDASDVADETTDETAPPPAPVPRFWTLLVYARADHGPAPDFLWGGALGIENASARSGLWAPGVRLGVGYSRRGDFVEEAGTARFEFASGWIDLCPAQGISEIFRLQLCGSLEAGVVAAQGRETFAPGRSTRPWVAVGPSLSSEVLIFGPIGLTYRAAAVFPLIRDEFQFNRSVFHKVPATAIELNAGVSARF